MCVGTSGWSYPRWRPKFYPADLQPREFLRFYSSKLNAVGVDYTFCGRHVLSQRTAERWLAQTPEEFVFSFRGPKPITHFYRHRLRNAEGWIRQFEGALRPFHQAGRLGVVLFQLPKTFIVDARVLDEFLCRWPRELRVSFEFRNPSWFTDEVYEILRRHETALCLAERDEMTTPEVRTANLVYMRLRKSSYSSAALQSIAERIRRYVRTGDVFAFFRQDGDDGPRYAQRVLRRLEKRVVARNVFARVAA